MAGLQAGKEQTLLHHMSGQGSQGKLGQTRYLKSSVPGAVCCLCQDKRHQVARKMQIAKPSTCYEQPPMCHEVPDKSSHEDTGRKSSPSTRQQIALCEWLPNASISLPHEVTRKHIWSLRHPSSQNPLPGFSRDMQEFFHFLWERPISSTFQRPNDTKLCFCIWLTVLPGTWERGRVW